MLSTIAAVPKRRQEWDLAVVWRDPGKGDEVASYALSGLSPRDVCRLLDLRGRTPAVYPVPVHANEAHRLQPFAHEQLSMPDGTTGELWPIWNDDDDDLADGPRTLWPLFAYFVVGGTLGPLGWHWGHSAHAPWARLLLQLGAGLFSLLAIWCAGCLLVLIPLSLIAKRHHDEPGD
jgi:hypothetical protein